MYIFFANLYHSLHLTLSDQCSLAASTCRIFSLLLIVFLANMFALFLFSGLPYPPSSPPIPTFSTPNFLTPYPALLLPWFTITPDLCHATLRSPSTQSWLCQHDLFLGSFLAWAMKLHPPNSQGSYQCGVTWAVHPSGGRVSEHDSIQVQA